MTNVKALETLFHSSFRVIKFSSIKWKNNNAPYTIKPLKFLSLLLFYFYRISKDDCLGIICELFGFSNCERFNEKKISKKMNIRDTYRDMLHDNGFCIMQCVFSQASTWTSNHINNDTVVPVEVDFQRSNGTRFKWIFSGNLRRGEGLMKGELAVISHSFMIF